MGKPHGKDILQEPQITGPQEIPRPFKIQKISDSTSNPSTPLKIYGDSTDIFLQNSASVKQYKSQSTYDNQDELRETPSTSNTHQGSNTRSSPSQKQSPQINKNYMGRKGPLFVYDEEHVQDSVQERQLSLIGKLLAEKDIPDGILQKILNGIWCNPSGLKIQEIGEKLYLLNIEKEEDLKRILKGSPWNVRNCLFMVKQWNMNTSKEVPTSPIFFSSTAEMERLSKDFKGKAPMEEVPDDGGECSRARELCSICLNEISTAERVGLLQSCDHPFCHRCICDWRRSGHATWRKRKGCPICCKVSFYVVPSDSWVTGEARKQRIDEYIRRCRLIHCRYFARGDGLCPHRHRCFYRHEVFPHSYRWCYGTSPPPPPPPPPAAAQSPDTEIERILGADDYDFSDDSHPDSA